MNKTCKEWIENGVQWDNHDWKEVGSNEKIQTLQCQNCNKASTAKWSNPEQYQEYKESLTPNK